MEKGKSHGWSRFESGGKETTAEHGPGVELKEKPRMNTDDHGLSLEELKKRRMNVWNLLILFVDFVCFRG